MLKTLLLFLLSFPAFSQLAILPHPAVVKPERGNFSLRAGLRVWASPACANERQLLDDYWKQAGLPPLTPATKPKTSDIQLLVDGARYEALGTEGYELRVSPRRIVVAGASSAGVFHGLQTLRQLLPTMGVDAVVPAVLVRDKPRFSWRSFTLDEGQHSEGIETLKKLLDELALLKFNRFQWSMAATRDTPTIYTLDEVDRIKQYGRARHIHVDIRPASPSAAYSWANGNTTDLLKTIKSGQDAVVSTTSETHLSASLAQLPLDRVYRFEPIPDQLPEDLLPRMLGVNYTFLSEVPPTSERLFSQLHPRLAAAAEVAWTFQQDKKWNRFQQALEQFTKRWW